MSRRGTLETIYQFDAFQDLHFMTIYHYLLIWSEDFSAPLCNTRLQSWVSVTTNIYKIDDFSACFLPTIFQSLNFLRDE